MDDIATKPFVCALALACYGSFLWSILFFFQRSAATHPRMKLISVTGTCAMIAHLTGLLLFAAESASRMVSAALLYVLSLCLFWWALTTTKPTGLSIAYDPKQSSQLVRSGPYLWSRHPIYASYLLAWIAGAIAIPHAWPWLIVIVMGLQYLAAISHEERRLLAGPIADDYRQYRRETGMIVPTPNKLFVRCSAAKR